VSPEKQHNWPQDPGAQVWRTLGYRWLDDASLEWDAGEDYAFPDGAGGSIIHGGLVATLLDTAMGTACLNGLDDGQRFLTADLHVDFYRATRPGTLRATGRIVHRTRRAVFCAADLHEAEGALLASARATQIVR
jgi:uncharacterized protein (TIGR00369 family)